MQDDLQISFVVTDAATPNLHNIITLTFDPLSPSGITKNKDRDSDFRAQETDSPISPVRQKTPLVI